MPLYIRSFFSKTAIYRASYIEQDIRSIGAKSVVHIRLRPVLFSEGDKLESPFMANSKIIPGSNLIQTAIDGDLIYDEDTRILYALEARLIGKDQRTSLLDIHKNRKCKGTNVLAFLANLAHCDGDAVKVGSIRNKQPVSYRDVLQESLEPKASACLK